MTCPYFEEGFEIAGFQCCKGNLCVAHRRFLWAILIHVHHHLSSVQNPCRLMIIGDYCILPNILGIVEIHHYWGIPFLTEQYNGMAEGF